ncbi:hypothetical protein B9Z55_010791 [Caenorhabditis nigoni]|uniref:Uncharacterized protein n=1 Tax=Caenorhabditis nigoni TaxID=1611254 RepID=A0A2G5UHA3_9PELO|nr:hypothetical protein B9Z55_010791 [Caenorhabditis nigoni]
MAIISRPPKLMTWIGAIVYSVQALFLIFQFWEYVNKKYDPNQSHMQMIIELIRRIVMIFISGIVFVGFVTEEKVIMKIHILFMTSLLAIPITTLFATVFSFFKSLEGGAMLINNDGAKCINIEGVMCNLLYITFCYILLADIKYGHPGVLPYTSKVHGSSQDSEKLTYGHPGTLPYTSKVYESSQDSEKLTYGHPGTLPYTSKAHESSQDSEELIYPKI